MFYTYIIWSSNYEIFFKGITQNIEHRLFEHNNDFVRFTSGKGPWVLVYLKQHTNKREAIWEEKRIKRLNERSIQSLINSPSNIAPPLG